MRKTVVLIVLLVVMSMCFVLTAVAADQIKPLLSDQKDGLLAELSVSQDGGAEQAEIKLKLTNRDAVNVSDISVELTLPDGLVSEQGSESQAVTLATGDSCELSYTVKQQDEQEIPQGSIPLTPPNETEEPGGCGSVMALSAVVTATAAGAALLVKKNKKGAVAIVMLAAMVVTSFAGALPASAAETERKITLVGAVTFDGVEYPVEVSVNYIYSFTETKAEGTDGMNKFEITYYWGPHGENMYNEEFIKAIAECGFTSIPLENNSVEANKAALALLKKYGLTCSALWDYRINDVAGHDRTVSPNTSQEDVDKVVAAVVADYAEFDNIEGWWVQDEPCAARFEILGKIVSAFKRFDPERSTMINLFPTYASASQLGASTYQKYLEQFVEQVDPTYLSYDHYHFKAGGVVCFKRLLNQSIGKSLKTYNLNNHERSASNEKKRENHSSLRAFEP